MLLPPRRWDIRIEWSSNFDRVNIEYIEDYGYADEVCPGLSQAIITNTVRNIVMLLSALGIDDIEKHIKIEGGKVRVTLENVHPIILQYMMVNEFMLAPLLPHVVKAEKGLTVNQLIQKLCNIERVKQKWEVSS